MTAQAAWPAFGGAYQQGESRRQGSEDEMVAVRGERRVPASQQLWRGTPRQLRLPPGRLCNHFVGEASTESVVEQRAQRMPQGHPMLPRPESAKVVGVGHHLQRLR